MIKLSVAVSAIAMLVAASGPRAAAAQGPRLELAGRVVTADGEPLPQAEVRLIRSRRGGYSIDRADAEGRFRFRHLTPGAYRITASGSRWILDGPPLEVEVTEASRRRSSWCWWPERRSTARCGAGLRKSSGGSG